MYVFEQQRVLVANSDPTEFIAKRTIPIILQSGKRELQVNALLDDCSSKTYVNADVAAKLRIEGRTKLINVSVLNGKNERFETQTVSLELKSTNGKIKREITAFTTSNVTGDLQALPWLKTRANWKHLSDIPFPKVKRGYADRLGLFGSSTQHTRSLWKSWRPQCKINSTGMDLFRSGKSK